MKEFRPIQSKENSLIKLISALQSSAKTRREENKFILEGLRICKDAFENGIRFDKLIISTTAFEKYNSEILDLSENSDDCCKIPDLLFKKISDTSSPQGILAIANTPNNNEHQINKKGKYIALENIADPSNLGAIARTAEALGVSGIILSNNGCDPFSPKVLRASMGTILRVPIIILTDFTKKIKEMPLKSFSCVVDSTAKSITDVVFQEGSVVIIGNEANGITDETKSVSDELITIPMLGRAESLNAAAAAAISIWEMMK